MPETNEKQSKRGRKPILDDEKRRKVIAIVANGSSRRVAGRIVGCSLL